MKHLPKIAIVAGGYSGEAIVSMKSLEGIRSFLKDAPYEIFSVIISKENWTVQKADGEIYPIDLNTFSFTDKDGENHRFDFAYITIHGTPGENGLFTGYLDMLGIPYSCCPTAIGALTFNKYMCNRYLSTFGIKTAPSIRLTREDEYSAEELQEMLPLPVFVKPNDGGSSLATTRVSSPDMLLPAIHTAFEEGEEVLVERQISGTEVTCGCYRDAKGLHVLPITEVVSHNDFFDYDAKYKGAVEEITPARISPELWKKIQTLTKEIYTNLLAQGIIRVDFIIEADNEPILLEVNTTPGMTKTSFIPQQIKAANLSMQEVLSDIIQYQIAQNKK